MQNISVSLIQTDLVWENKKANLQHFSEVLDRLNEHSDLIILPEMFSTGFSMNPEANSEKMEGPAMAWMHEWAEKKDAPIVGSIIVEEHGGFYNRLIWINPDGHYHFYDKRHLFGLGGEDQEYASGDRKVIVEYKGWKFCPMICYDLRFPVWIRNAEAYDCLIFVANWPAKRSVHWKTLLHARAIENQSYVLAVNRIGYDANKTYHQGDSMVISPFGDDLAIANDKQTLLHAVLDGAALINIREKMPFLRDQDAFELK